MDAVHKKPFIIGIAGGTASGKSTIGKRLAETLASMSVKLLHMDDYFLEERPRMIAPITRLEYEDHNQPGSFDLQKLVRDLAQYAAGQCEWDVLIVEGLLTLHHDAIRAFLDLKIFIDTPADERIVRRLKRNMAWGLSFDEIAAFYLDSVRYRHNEFVEPSRWHADIVLNGSGMPEKGLRMIAQWIRSFPEKTLLSEGTEQY